MRQAVDIAPGLLVLHGNQLEQLRQLVTGWVASHPLRPLESDVMVVQSNGIAQWLRMALAADPEFAADGTQTGGGCGIAAAVDVQLPARFLWQVYRAVLGAEAIPTESPLDKQPLTWRLLRLLPSLLTQTDFAPLARYLSDDAFGRRRYQLAERLADLYDQYQVYRADWLTDWAQGLDQLRLSRGGTQPLPSHQRWQAALWRALLKDLRADGLATAGSRALVHPQFLQAVSQLKARPSALPRRVVIFGLSALPAQALEVLAAIAPWCQVILAVLNPCQYYWGDIVEDRDLLRQAYRRQARKPGMPEAGLGTEDWHQHAHPLLAAWGRQGRDFLSLLDNAEASKFISPLLAAFQENRHDFFTEPATQTLLGQLQDDVLNLRPLAETRDLWPAVKATQDVSLRCHIAHSARREVEVLHDQLLARFAADPTLRPRDVIVMVPDVNTYAALVQAVFGQFERGHARHLPFALADQRQRGVQPLLIALEYLLALPEQRITATEIMDLLDVPAVRLRFGVQVGDLPLLRRWISQAGIRWGIDGAQRATQGMSAGSSEFSKWDANTWQFGIDRLLLGYAAGDTPLTSADGTTLIPCDEAAGLSAALLGPLSDLLDALSYTLRELQQPSTPEQWLLRLQQLMARFFSTEARPGTDAVAQAEADAALLSQLQTALESWLGNCRQAGVMEALPLVLVREAWLAGLDAGGLQQRFLAGSINFCTLMPMRAIPFRVVCLLGMNEADYPRRQPPLDFDLMAGDYRPGDRSRREDDRYLMLEALLSAREQLYISWVGRSVRDNSERAPSVLVGQLREHVAQGWSLAGGGDLLAALTTVHPLQPFSARYFTPGSGVFSYAGEWLAQHQQMAAAQVDEPLPALEPPLAITVEGLQRLLRDPVGQFFKTRLKVQLDREEQTLEDHEPFDLGGLNHHAALQSVLDGARLSVEHLPLDAALAALPTALAETTQRLQGEGRLPLAGFGQRWQVALQADALNQLQRWLQVQAQWPQAVLGGLSVALPASALQLSPESPASELLRLPSLYRSDAGLALFSLNASRFCNSAKTKLMGKDGLNLSKLRLDKLLGSWVLAVLAALQPEPVQVIVVARDVTLTWRPLDRDEAIRTVTAWLRAWALHVRQPLPVTASTALAFLPVNADKGEEMACAKAADVYEGGYKVVGEKVRQPSLARQFPDFEALWQDGEFAHWASALYEPMWMALEAGALSAVVADDEGDDA